MPDLTVCWTFLVSGCVTAIYVFLRALQQLHVVNGLYWRVFPTSLLMGLVDVGLILLIVKANTLWLGVVNGIGGATGCVCAMYLHNKLSKV